MSHKWIDNWPPKNNIKKWGFMNDKKGVHEATWICKKKKEKSTKENNYFSQVKIKVIFKVVNDFVLFLLIWFC